MKFFIGIDDAGRGPVVGPMFLAGVLVDDGKKKKFKKLGIKDSKQLFPVERKKLFKEIKKLCLDFKIVSSSASEIDHLIQTGTNLNKIEAQKTAKIINSLIKPIDKKMDVQIVVDCPSVNIVAWKNYLSRHIKKNEKVKLFLKCEHKADINHVEAAAASILAKVSRDSEIEKIKKEIGIDFGSGYPSDPETIDFLKKYGDKFKDYGIFRKTWMTWKTHMKKKSQKKLFEY